MGSSQAAFLLRESWHRKRTLFLPRTQKTRRGRSSPLPGCRPPARPPSAPIAPVPVAGLGSGRRAQVCPAGGWEKSHLSLFGLNTRSSIVCVCLCWQLRSLRAAKTCLTCTPTRNNRSHWRGVFLLNGALFISTNRPLFVCIF